MGDRVARQALPKGKIVIYKDYVAVYHEFCRLISRVFTKT